MFLCQGIPSQDIHLEAPAFHTGTHLEAPAFHTGAHLEAPAFHTGDPTLLPLVSMLSLLIFFPAKKSQVAGTY